MWITIAVLIYLAILGVADWRKRKVPILVLGVGGMLLVSIGIYRCVQGELWWPEMPVGVLPGVFMVLIARFSQKAGYADGVVLMQMGMCMGFKELMSVFCCSMLFLSTVSVILLLCKKVKKETKMPYLTFLAITFGIWQLCGG